MVVVGITRLLVFAVQGKALGVGLGKAKGSVLSVCAYMYLYVNVSAVA